MFRGMLMAVRWNKIRVFFFSFGGELGVRRFQWSFAPTDIDW